MTNNCHPELSIIFVNWNSAHYLETAITSTYSHTSGIHFEIIVVDNASPSSDADSVKKRFPEIQLMKAAVNLGFGRANNLGFQSASGQYVLFLNPDTKLVNPAINMMLDQLKSMPDRGTIGCKLLNSDLSLQTSCIQTFPTILNQVLDTDVLRKRWPASRLWGTKALYSDAVAAAKVEVVSGACLMIRREVFEKVGGFTEEYFMYAEDLDLCNKVVRAGYHNYYTGGGTVIHYGGGSSQPESATVMKWRSIIRYMVLNHSRVYALAFRAAMILAAMCRLLILAVARATSGAPASDEFSSYTKWKAILRTLLGYGGQSDQSARALSAATGKLKQS